MVVMKFGGTSVKDADAIRRVARIVSRAHAESRSPVVVVSAMSNVTDQLIEAATLASRGDEHAFTPIVGRLAARHREVTADLVPDGPRAALLPVLDADWNEVSQLLHALSVLREVSARSLDAIVASGEVASSRIVAAALAAASLPAAWVDARHVLVADGEHGAGQPDLAATRARLDEHVRPHCSAGRIPVLGGYIGATRDGVTCTLSRGGSDYSAAIFGAGLGADEIQIWTDVDGMLTADPRVVSGTRPVARLSFAEASELAYFGAKVLHPSTIAPALESGIPVRILNSHRPEAAGTTIVADPPTASAPITALACKRDVTVIDITSSRMLMAHGFMYRLFEVFERYRTSVDVVTTSEVSVSVTVDDTRHLGPILSGLAEFAHVTCDHDMALLCAVSEQLRTDASLSARILGALEGFPLRMVSQAGSRRNITVVLPQVHLPDAMTRLHEQFCSVREGAVTTA